MGGGNMSFRPDFIEISVPNCLSVTPLASWMVPSTFSVGLVGGGGVQGAEESLFVWTVRDMLECWSVLSIEEIFCGVVFLYNRGYRLEALFWYYVAWARLEHFSRLAEERCPHVQQVFVRSGSFLGALRFWMSSYGYYHPRIYAQAREALEEDLQALSWSKIYPLAALKVGLGEQASFVGASFGASKFAGCGELYLPGMGGGDGRFEALPSFCLVGGWVKSPVGGE